MTIPRRRNRPRFDRLDPQRIRIRNEEILADLLYPARSSWAVQSRGRDRRR